MSWRETTAWVALGFMSIALIIHLVLDDVDAHRHRPDVIVRVEP